ncbi:MAG: hypothetical protein Q4C96_05450 [Planctomycetia bacterium]|nr:hypothetical protein [Planctomycetia bacterium]
MRRDVYVWPENNAFSVASSLNEDDSRMYAVSRGAGWIIWSVVAGLIAYGVMYALLFYPSVATENGIPLGYLLPALYIPSVIFSLIGGFDCSACPERFVENGRKIILGSWLLYISGMVFLGLTFNILEGFWGINSLGMILITCSNILYCFFLIRMLRGLESPEYVPRAKTTIILLGIAGVGSAIVDVFEKSPSPMKWISSLMDPYINETLSISMYFNHFFSILVFMGIIVYLFLLWGIIWRIQRGTLP